LDPGYRRVAVKMLKSNHSREELHDLLSEFSLLKVAVLSISISAESF
jgi:hypothetical protein